MVGSTGINIFEVRRSSTTVCCIRDISGRACLSALVVGKSKDNVRYVIRNDRSHFSVMTDT